MSTEQTSFRALFPREPVLIDERRQISPHFLGIGKTRKIIDTGSTLVGFYSVGYAIEWVFLDRTTLGVTARGRLDDVPVAWGGGQFCVDHVEDAVHLVYTAPSRLFVQHRRGRIMADRIVWEQFARTAIAASTPTLAAPWIATDRFGGIWVSAVGKDGNFIVAHANERDGERFAFRQKRLFDGAVEWHHSCVQILPYARRKAVAVGFTGKFPTETALVAKTIDDELMIGPTTVVGACDVNDQITFHFQALGDPDRGRAVVTYLGPRGRIDHATWDGARWRVEEAIVPFPTIAPQNTLLGDGEIGVVCADYEGQMFALSSSSSGWSKPRAVSRRGLVSISPAFARTGYGTGGVIAAARSGDRRMAFLASELALDPEAPAKLFAGVAGGDEALVFAPDKPATVEAKGRELILRAPVVGGVEADLTRAGFGWNFSFQDDHGDAVQVWLLSESPRPKVLIFASEDGAHSAHGEICFAIVALKRERDETVIEARLSSEIAVRPRGAQATSYEGVVIPAFGLPTGRMVDTAPFVQEPNSIVARDPRLLPQVFRRIV